MVTSNPFLASTYTASAPGGAGLQYRPLAPGRSLAGGALSGIGQLLLALGAGRPDAAGAAFTAGLQGFDENQARRAAQAQNDALFGMQAEQYQTGKQEKADAKAQAAKDQANFEAAIDAMNLPPDQKLAIKAGVAKYGDFNKKPEGPQSPLGKLESDHKNGLISDADYAAAVQHENYIAPQQAPASNLITLVGPDGKSVRSLDSRDPQVKTLAQAGWVERPLNMFAAPPAGYTAGPADASGNPTLTPVPGGPADPKSKAPTEDQIKSAQLYRVMAPELETVSKTFDALASPKAQMLSVLPGGNAMQSAEYQEGANSLRTIVASYLYVTSGATANPGEVQTQVDVLMPRFGDKKEALADKKARIQNMVDTVRQRAGNALGTSIAPPTDQGTPVASAAPAGAPDYTKMSDQELLDYIKTHGAQ